MMVDQIVVSVGPYNWVRRPTRLSNCVASSGTNASPPISAWMRSSTRSSLASRMRHSDGVACTTLMCSSAINRDRPRGSWLIPAGAMTTRAPTSNGRYSSSPAISKVMVVTASTRSRGRNASSCSIACRKLNRLRWLISTPLGAPVEPEVYSTYAVPSGVASGAIASGNTAGRGSSQTMPSSR